MAICACGCGGEISRYRRFLPGHDAKLRSAIEKRIWDAGRAIGTRVGPGQQIAIRSEPKKIGPEKELRTSFLASK